MAQPHAQLIDLLEVFHARQVRRGVLDQLRRLRDEDNFLPGGDVDQRRRVIRHYEALHREAVELLRSLGDIAPATDQQPAGNGRGAADDAG